MLKKIKTIKLKHKPEAGVAFIEVLIALAIVSIAFAVLLGVGTVSLGASTLMEKKTDALLLAKEGIEAVRSFRDATTWDTDGLAMLFPIGDSNPYRLVLQDNSPDPKSWDLQAGTETIGIFTRKIIFDRVSRDPLTNDIEDPYYSGNYDPDTRKVTVIVEWETNYSLQLVTYFTNWQ